MDPPDRKADPPPRATSVLNEPLRGVEARVLDLVRRHGWNATSYQILQPGFEYFFVGDDACVGYVDTGRAWVAAGAPLCDPDQFRPVVDAFLAAARSRGRRASFFGTEARFASQVPLRSLLIGEQAVWEPSLWPQTVARVRSLREQLRRARSKGVRVRTASPHELSQPGSPTGIAVTELVRRWRDRHELAPMGFLVDFDPLAARADHRLYLAEVDGGKARAPGGAEGAPRLVGLLVAAPIFARRGWLLQAVIRAPDAPNGTAELLVDEAMRAAARGDDELVTLGLAPLAGGVASPLRWARAAGSVLFDFHGLRSFKAKLRPVSWEVVYLSFSRAQGVLPTLLDVLTAFARGRLLRFGVQTLLRGPAVLVRLLTVALVPWTAALAAAPAGRWFPHPAVKWAWVAFDLLLITGMVSLWRGRRWRDWLAGLLLMAVGADAALTTVEALTWNLPRLSGATESVVVATAVLAPLLAFAVLWRIRARRS
ncbi:MAG: DUF2156 domain-containing protein [Myxococcales bacterium]